jgi:hypothetical protein
MVYVHSDRVPSKLRDALRTYMERRRTQRPVSIKTMLKRTRYAMPELTASDEELAEMIAEQIILNGGNVDFDGKEAG